MGNCLIIIPTAISTNMLLLYGLCMREKTVKYPVMIGAGGTGTNHTLPA